MQPTEADRRLGALLHLASIPAPYMAPLVGLAVGWNRPFLRFQAVKSLLEQLVAGFCVVMMMLASISFSIYQLAQTNFDFSKIDWWQLILKSVAVWLILLAFQGWNIINALRDAKRAWDGTVPPRPKWTERVALRWAGNGALTRRQS